MYSRFIQIYRFLACPKLIHINNKSDAENYHMNKIEKLSSIYLNIACLLNKLLIYAAIPLLILGLDKFVLFYLLIILRVSRITLSLINLVGRWNNSIYMSFFAQYCKVIDEKDHKDLLKSYDYDFRCWPVDYSAKCSDPGILDELKPDSPINHLFDLKYMSTWVVMRLIGRPLVYPGSIDITRDYFEPILNDGRATLIEQYNGQRAKIRTLTGTDIDTMFLDRRNCHAGQFLVICSEGNCSFYECGSNQPILSLGHSVLAWNHPGFGASSGLPFLHEEKNAIFAVISYAIEELGFHTSRIILYGWSIGGYSCAFGAALFPSIDSVIVDGTFHSIIPVAKNSMADIFHVVVEAVMKTHFDLDVARLLHRYNGPLLILRRTNDEIVSLVTNDVSTNCGNCLALSVLQNRFPVLFTEDVLDYCKHCIGVPAEARVKRYSKYKINEVECQNILNTFLGDGSACESATFGNELSEAERLKFALFLLDKTLCDVVERHSVPLPLEFFARPWRPCGTECFAGCHYHYVA